jgi:hypothetical protein
LVLELPDVREAQGMHDSLGDLTAAGRCKDIAADIMQEIDYVDGLIGAQGSQIL